MPEQHLTLWAYRSPYSRTERVYTSTLSDISVPSRYCSLQVTTVPTMTTQEAFQKAFFTMLDDLQPSELEVVALKEFEPELREYRLVSQSL